MKPSSQKSNGRARLVALSARYLTWGTMRGIFTIANISTIVLLAYQIGTDPGWWMALFAIVMSILAYASDKKQRRVEHQVAGDAAIDHLFDAAVSARQRQSAHQALEDSSGTGWLDDDR